MSGDNDVTGLGLACEGWIDGFHAVFRYLRYRPAHQVARRQKVGIDVVPEYERPATLAHRKQFSSRSNVRGSVMCPATAAAATE